ncbi:MAG: DUF4442 domain-containing protein [Proteobacteria bacterium]|nr:DUF4442 domain-containing protein [Pseudomonadota bacterium]
MGTSAPARWAFSQAVCVAAPYFRSIRPRFLVLEPGHVEVFVRKRRRVTNHLGTVHAIAMCNIAELCGGVCLDLAVPDSLRWIPVGMEVRYEKLAKTSLRGVCKIELDDLVPGDVRVPVEVFDTSGQRVFSADITMRISEKRAKAA